MTSSVWRDKLWEDNPRAVVNRLSYLEFVALRDKWVNIVEGTGFLYDVDSTLSHGNISPRSAAFYDIFHRYKVGDEIMPEFCFREGRQEVIRSLLAEGYSFPYRLRRLTEEEADQIGLINVMLKLADKSMLISYNPLKRCHGDGLKHLFSQQPSKQISTRPFHLVSKNGYYYKSYSKLDAMIKYVSEMNL